MTNSKYMPSQGAFIGKMFKHRRVNHVAFWVVFTLTTAYYGSLFGGTFEQNLANMISLLPVHIAASYLIVYILIPKYLFTKKILIFSIALIVTIFLAAILSRLSIIYIAEPIVRGSVDSETLWQIISHPMYLLQVYVPSVLLPISLLFLLKMTKERFNQSTREAQLVKEKQASELNFLKAQMNPHLLFNTLNNIYSLAKSGSEDTPEMIMKLSDILNYTLYECNENRVLLSKEWELIENYADLEALRYTKRVDLILTQKIENTDAHVAPLLLIVLVENAFKHGISNSDKSTPLIKIDLTESENVLSLKVSNTKAKSTMDKSTNNGIGIKNLQKQLNLQYPNDHNISITESDHMYEVELTICL